MGCTEPSDDRGDITRFGQRSIAGREGDPSSVAIDPFFDDLTRIAARHFAVPMAAVNLVDEVRVRRLAGYGNTCREIRRDEAFCGDVVSSGRNLVVLDAAADERYAELPSVLGGPGLRFYAAAPLRATNGAALGTFCLLDVRPRRRFDRRRQGDLEGFARLAIGALEARAAAGAAEDARALAEEKARARARFLATASHDLRQPLQSVLLFGETLAQHVIDPAGSEKLSFLNGGLESLKALLDSLLDLSRLEAGVVAATLEAVPLTELLEHLHAAYAPLADAKGLVLRVSEATAAIRTAAIRTDRVLLGRMLRNLLENAIRYTEQGEIAVTATPDARRVRVEVRDTGIGIPRDQLERIFEEFHRVETGATPAETGPGMGLGLSIVRHLSRLLDHPVTVSSVPGQGSTFTVSVPLAADLPAAPALPDPAQAASAGARRLAVLVDDDGIVLLGLQAMLREWDYEVLAATGIDHMLRLAAAAKRIPDVVIADYRLAGGEVGTDAIRRLRGLLGAAIPGIVLTGEVGAEPERDAARLGLRVVCKPVTPRQLHASLASLFRTGPAR